MKLKGLIGAGHRIVAVTLPVAAASIAANLAWPSVFRLGAGDPGRALGIALLGVGVPGWIWAVAQILAYAPRGRLITSGPFAIVLHPIYTSVALLVLPGLGFLLDTWAAFPIGATLYAASRIFSPREERELARSHPAEYTRYRERVLFPWL